MTENRKFSPKKLYKLASFVVIIISLLSLWLVKASYDNISYFQDQSAKHYTMCKNNYNQKAFQDFTNQEKERAIESCDNIFVKVDQDMIDSYKKDIPWGLGFGLYLPIIFFGGTWIFRYIFPKE